MTSFAQQLQAASVHAARVSAEKKRQAAEQDARLPAGEKKALLLSEVEALIEDVPHAYTGLSATLVNLIKQDLVCRTGERRQFRYFKP